jgi:hypothetical protein
MYSAGRHAALTSSAWSAQAARAAIQEIVTDAATRFDARRFWPAHPLDEQAPNGSTGLYWGAIGVIWAMDFLRREGAADHGLDFTPVLPELLEANRREFAAVASMAGIEPRRASYLFGDVPALLLMMRVASDAGVADELHRRIEENLDLPLLEIMWGAAGTMLTCVFAAEMTREDRWRNLYLAQARRLLADLEETDGGPLWTQNLYGKTRQFLGPVHGYAGNMQALIRGWPWLSDAEQARVKGAVSSTLSMNVLRGEMGANWPALATGETQPERVQYCHGAPGMVTVFAARAVADPNLMPLLEEGARLTWGAGPLAKGSNLCHGTGGNGYAFLKLFDLTGEPVWLERARAFAMTAIDQFRAASAQYGQGRYSLWTGDIGLAVYLHECIISSARFPTVDVF